MTGRPCLNDCENELDPTLNLLGVESSLVLTELNGSLPCEALEVHRNIAVKTFSDTLGLGASSRANLAVATSVKTADRAVRLAPMSVPTAPGDDAVDVVK